MQAHLHPELRVSEPSGSFPGGERRQVITGQGRGQCLPCSAGSFVRPFSADTFKAVEPQALFGRAGDFGLNFHHTDLGVIRVQQVPENRHIEICLTAQFPPDVRHMVGEELEAQLGEQRGRDFMAVADFADEDGSL